MEEFQFVEEAFETDFSDDVFVEGKIFADTESDTITVHYLVVDRAGKQKILEQSIAFECKDDIYITKFDPTFSPGAYGICVANKLAHATYDEIKNCYDAAKGRYPNKGQVWERIKDTADCLSKKTGLTTTQIKKALKECLTFGLIVGGGTGP